MLTTNPVGNYMGKIPTPINHSFKALSHGTVHFKPSENTPRYFYYQCENHPFEGGLCIVHDE